MITLAVQRLENHDPDLPMPGYETEDAAGMDLRGCLADPDRPDGLKLPSLARALIPTGLAVAIPRGHEAQIRPRSGLAARHGITVLNSPGTIDADYRGEISVILINHGDAAFEIKRGERIAQLVIAPVSQAGFVSAETLSDTDRGRGGFGSTGQ